MQGSILGPILFNIFINGLHCYLSAQCKIVSYADDSTIIHSAPPSQEGLSALKNGVESDLVNLATWFKNNGLKVNPTKTEMFLLGKPAAIKKMQAFGVEFDGVSLSPTEHIKFSGVLLYQNLTMEKQTARVVRQCFGILITLKKLSFTLPKSALVYLIQALVSLI